MGSVYSCCASYRQFDSQHSCFGFPTKDDTFDGSAFYVLFKKVAETRHRLGLWNKVKV